MRAAADALGAANEREANPEELLEGLLEPGQGLSVRARVRLPQIRARAGRYHVALNALTIAVPFAIELMVWWPPWWPGWLKVVGVIGAALAFAQCCVANYEIGGELVRLRHGLAARLAQSAGDAVESKQCNEARRKTLSDLVNSTLRGIDETRRLQQNHTAGAMTVIVATGIAAAQAMFGGGLSSDDVYSVKRMAASVFTGTTFIWLISHMGFSQNLMVKVELVDRYLMELGRNSNEATLLRHMHAHRWRAIGFVLVYSVVTAGICGANPSAKKEKGETKQELSLSHAAH